MNIILLGPPGAGKGTLSNKILENLDAVQIATGDLFRYNIHNKTPLGLKAKEYMDQGNLVPDELTIDLLWDYFDKQENTKSSDKIVLFDGFPRNLSQAQALDQGMEDRGQKIDVVIYFDVDEDILIERVTGRRVCPNCGATYHIINHPPKVDGICDKCKTELIQRADDTLETVKNRIDVYNEQTAVLIDYYTNKGILKSIDGSKTIDEVFEEFKHKLGEIN
ncbi:MULTISPECIES: adenylate kinase [Anaerococcus]|uniref:Adenylate kinase n=1 Tax=Anaerococcus nagyae TaxID=1755241 RepID=A0A3E2TL16_9FIRM|nr:MULTISPECIES: adenylate kinase [Anaerococcus]MDU1828145.1 adenylate kinase [Anaerococcus sp.]MDU1864350.1 adenylate kinase [Anaerococcus sp.]MDU3210959.1 adenylate kinase [Anaerococcus sp.]RGB78062.1 adenylate kinase [Anaerococcus nagyae]